jgi:hypothetical protein
VRQRRTLRRSCLSGTWRRQQQGASTAGARLRRARVWVSTGARGH